MKSISHPRKSFFIVFFLLAVQLSQSQKKFTVVASRENNYCNTTCTLFDNPDLNGNPTAVVFVKAVETNGINLNPHPITAYYNGRQWSVMNTDNASMPVGARFDVEYYSKPDENHFVQVVTKENLVRNNTYIDNPKLNGNPKAQFQVFQSASPNVRGGGVNRSEIKYQFDEAVGKWYLTNSNGNAMDISTGFSISIPEVQVAINNATNNGNTNNGSTNNSNTTPFNPGPATDHSGQRVFVTVTGQVQGAFIGEAGSGRMEVTGFEMENISPRDLATGQASGKRQHMPIVFEKALGAASAQFFKAFTTNEIMPTIIFEVYSMSEITHASELTYKIILTNAKIMYFKQSLGDGSKGFTDTIKATYTSIELNYINGGVSASDTWQVTN